MGETQGFDMNITVPMPMPGRVKGCPCCGTEAEIKGVLLYNVPCVVIRCPKCLIQTSPAGERNYIFYHGKKNVRLSFDDAMEDAIRAWNLRTAAPKDELERQLLSAFRSLDEAGRMDVLNFANYNQYPDEEGSDVDG